ncbi:hypothetical protein SeLEV6574_g01334 [Synchytrium endobioticum]|uniref:Chromo domain-containing protein n=1 Tax=Synchytrium endobioticum TaxID=286115 RepID=A0A507DDP6_9FUNG|nr:hypothetical protein SeLEV6574_g01334 [Synchytrium endobioticum]
MKLNWKAYAAIDYTSIHGAQEDERLALQTIYRDLLVWDNTNCCGCYGTLSVIPSSDTSIAISIPGSTNNTKSNTMPIPQFSTITIIRLYLFNPFASNAQCLHASSELNDQFIQIQYHDHDEGEYVVEKILYSVRGRGRGGPLSYVVKWVGRNEVATLKANDERLAEFQGQLPNVQLLSNSEHRRRLRVLKKLGGFSA